MEGEQVKVAVVGATGNVGTSVLRALGEAPEVESIRAIARRVPQIALPKTRWVAADMALDDLRPHLDGVDAVIHLAWLIQPSRDPELTSAVNVDGLDRLLGAVADTAPALVYASSVGAYSPGPKDRAVDESWPTDGIDGSYYSEQKAAAERLLDGFEAGHPGVRVVRLRPGLIFKGEAASQIRRFFLGPFAPSPLFRRKLLPVIPNVPGLRFQAVHSDDVGDAYRRAVLQDVRGAFNVAADPVLDPPTLAEALGARLVPFPGGGLRSAAAASWRLRLQPTSPGWVDMALGVPIMDTSRARSELGWAPSRTSVDAFLELLSGIADGEDYPTPPLAGETSGRFRSREIRAGIGGRAL